MIRSLDNTEYTLYADMVRAMNAAEDKRAFVITFGCQQNEADGERMKGILVDMGYSITDDYTSADVILVNTCAIREHAEAKVLSMLGNYKALKKQKPQLVVGVLGCMAAEAHVVDSLKKNFHYISFTLEPNRLFEIPKTLYGILTGGKRSFVLGADDGGIVEGLPTVRTNAHRAWVSVMYGCNNFCTYCIVPYVRGRERSRDSSVIINECKELVASGCKEITLLGQNVNSYHSDISFAQLLSRIADIEGEFIIRFMTSHPKDVSDELIAVMRDRGDKIAPFFHLPLQSGSSRILKMMNRAYTKERYLEVVRKLREAVPNIALSTDIIVGFPDEREDDFEQTMQVLSDVQYDAVYAFIYSPREGTPAARLTSTVPDTVKTARLTALLKAQDDIAVKKNGEYVGSVQRVLVDSCAEVDGLKMYEGRTFSNKLVHFTSEREVLHSFVNVKIEKAAPYDMLGVAVE